MSKIHLTLSFFLICILSHAQLEEFNINYTPLRSSGTLPEIYTRSATEKADADIAAMNKVAGVMDKKAKKRFYTNSNFSQDRFLRSGKILFNDPVSIYVNKVADEVFKAHPDLRKQIQIYLVKSDVVNAYCFDNGVILVNLGLIAQLGDEAQLASVLTHEASHFVKKHSLESYVMKNVKKKKFKTGIDWDEYKYNHSSELEADVQGVKFFKESNYAKEGVQGSFNVLKNSHLPYEDQSFDKTFFEDSNLVFPSEFFLKKVAAIKQDEDYDDSKSTHPNIKKRKDAIKVDMDSINTQGKELFLVSKADFLKVREMARFELCKIALIDREYAACIYNCYLLQKKYPNNIFLRTTIGKALFEIAAVKSPENWNYQKPLSFDLLENSEEKNIYYDYSSKEGSSQQIYHLLNKLNAPQACILALNYNWKLKRELKDKDNTPARLSDSLFVLLALNNSKDVNYFNSTSRNNFVKKIQDQMEKDDSVHLAEKLNSFGPETDSATKADQIRTLKVELMKAQIRADSVTNAQLDLYFEKYAFADHLKDPEFVKKFEAAIELKKKVFRPLKDYEKVENSGLGIEKVVILDPFYLKVDQTTGGSLRYYESEKKLDQYNVLLKENAALVGLDFNFVDSKTLKKEEIEKYNDFTELNDWMSEFLNHNFNANTLVLNNDAAKLIKAKYTTKYMLWSGIIGVKLPKKYPVANALFTLLFYPAPFTLPNLIQPTEASYYISILYDVENSKICFYQVANTEHSDTKDFLNAFIYDTLLKIKKQPKKKNKA
jgi:hypothetical protein